ncbi:glucokinase [Legionella israelensis]|uniref:glucokinase n=1 Tax=Legionella israelensis TaxID=454 RepID=UPI0011810CA9|nr:glucokinase [Legionella israelensis]QDP72572.1 glucokinase [Legionella israelensis]
MLNLCQPDSVVHAIVADIGGTNARFGYVNLDNLNIDKLSVYSCKDFSTPADALNFYQEKQSLQHVKHVAIAIACPVASDFISMTNFCWQFSASDLKNQLGLSHLQVMNDFTAMAMSLPQLTSQEKIQIGSGVSDPQKPMVVLGAGTGLGVATLIPDKQRFISVPGEGGHINWASQNEQEWFIQQFLTKQFGRVSAERLLSGPGIENIYRALAAYYKKKVDFLNASEIAHLALTEKHPLALATVKQFFASLGGFAGDLALTLGAFGGVYIAGGIVPKLLPLLHESEFRARFEAKGRFDVYNRHIPTYVVSAEQPGILGAAVLLKQKIMDEQYGL